MHYIGRLPASVLRMVDQCHLGNSTSPPVASRKRFKVCELDVNKSQIQVPRRRAALTPQQQVLVARHCSPALMRPQRGATLEAVPREGMVVAKALAQQKAAVHRDVPPLPLGEAHARAGMARRRRQAWKHLLAKHRMRPRRGQSRTRLGAQARGAMLDE